MFITMPLHSTNFVLKQTTTYLVFSGGKLVVWLEGGDSETGKTLFLMFFFRAGSDVLNVD